MDYNDYIVERIRSILDWNDEAAKRISGVYNNSKVRDRKNKIRKIYGRIKEREN